MLELEVYAAGVRKLDKILKLDRELEGVHALRYKIDSAHDIVYMEFDEPTLSLNQIRKIFDRVGLTPKFVGPIPPELNAKSKTQLLNL